MKYHLVRNLNFFNIIVFFPDITQIKLLTYTDPDKNSRMIPDCNDLERGLTAVPENSVFYIQSDSVTLQSNGQKKEFGKKFGYNENSIDGTFCAGGAESNLTAVLSAINHHFPDFAETGAYGIDQKPIIYCSTESHHSVARAARVTGLALFPSLSTLRVKYWHW